MNQWPSRIDYFLASMTAGKASEISGKSKWCQSGLTPFLCFQWVHGQSDPICTTPFAHLHDPICNPVCTDHLRPGNLTQSVSFANTSSYTYDITGTAVTTTSNGHSASATNSASNNYAAPSQITATNSLTTTFNWNQYLAPTSSTGPNGDTASTVYDPNTARPTSSTSPYGAVTTYTYANTAPQVTATVNGRWTQTYLDGLGRTYRVATGYSNTTSPIPTRFTTRAAALPSVSHTRSACRTRPGDSRV